MTVERDRSYDGGAGVAGVGHRDRPRRGRFQPESTRAAGERRLTEAVRRTAPEGEP